MVQSSFASAQGEPSVQDSGTAGQNGLAVRLSDLARSLQQEDDSEEILVNLVHAAMQLIPGVDEASVSVVIDRRNVGSRAPSSDLPRQIDALQEQVHQGPCLDAVYEHQTVRVPDMSREPRWLDFAKRAYELGAGSMLSFQLYVQGDNLGALNLYARSVNAFSDDSEQVGLLVASHAAVAFAEAQKSDQLNDALATRDLIGHAKGILMERHKLTGPQAFLLLSRASQHANLKLREVADRLVNSGELQGGRSG